MIPYDVFLLKSMENLIIQKNHLLQHLFPTVSFEVIHLATGSIRIMTNIFSPFVYAVQNSIHKPFG